MSEENTTNEAKLYELGFHLNPAINSDQISSKIDEIKNVLTKNGGEIVKEGEPESMQLAYEITKNIAGKNERFTTSTFSWIKFNATSESIESIKEEIDTNDEIIRSLITKTTDDEEHSTSKIAREEDEQTESEEDTDEKEEKSDTEKEPNEEESEDSKDTDKSDDSEEETEEEK